MPALDVSDASFDAEVVRSDIPVVAPCKAMAPTLDALADELRGRAKIAKLQMDDNTGVVSRIGVRSAPTLMIFRAGQPIAVKYGAASKRELERWIAASI